MKPLLNESIQQKAIDVRMAEKNVQRGVLSHEEFSKHLSKLPDDSVMAERRTLDQLMKDDGGSLSKK